MVEGTCTYTTTRRSDADLSSDFMSRGLLDIPEQNYSYDTASLHIRGVVKAFLRIWRRGMIIWILERARVATKITEERGFARETIFKTKRYR